MSPPPHRHHHPPHPACSPLLPPTPGPLPSGLGENAMFLAEGFLSPPHGLTSGECEQMCLRTRRRRRRSQLPTILPEPTQGARGWVGQAATENAAPMTFPNTTPAAASLRHGFNVVPFRELHNMFSTGMLPTTELDHRPIDYCQLI